MTSRVTRRYLHAFTLIEVLMAIFILALGIIGIAALLPAGIVQQQRSAADIIGPVVANNAVSILRGKLRDDDFGITPETGHDGDWLWIRPAMIYAGQSSIDPLGGIDIFGTTGEGVIDPDSPFAGGIPYSTLKWGMNPPTIIVTQAERYYPQSMSGMTQYTWDCMFRRFQGRVHVAIFVYRAGGQDTPGGIRYTVAQPLTGGTLEMPMSVDLTVGSEAWRIPWNAFGADAGDLTDDALIPGTTLEFDPSYSPLLASASWQVESQWLLDQNNQVHRVLSGRDVPEDGPVELVRAPAEVLADWPFVFPIGAADLYPNTPPMPGNGFADVGVVGKIWYVPAIDSAGRSLTPIYITVKEL